MPDRHTGFIFSSLDKTVEILDFSTKSAPQATVVVVTYKRNQQLLECLASLARQSYKNFETIVIDNGKNEAVHAGLSKYNVRHILLKKNYGLSIGRNIGIEYARSDIVIFLDDDALAGPNLVKSHVEAHQELNIVGLRGKAIGKTRTIYNDLQQHYDLGEEIRLCVLPADNDVIKEKLFRANCFCHSASIFRKKCIERVGAYRETFKMAQDYDLWLRIAEEFDVSNIEEPLCKWRANPCSITISKKAEQDLYAQLAYSLAIQRQVFGQDKLGYKPPGEQFRLLRRKLVAGYFAKKRIVSNKYLMCAEKYPHIVKLTILVIDPIGSPLLLLCSERAKLLYIDTLLLPADKPGWIYFFGRFSGMKKAALEKFVPKCDIFFFFFKVHQVGGTMGAAI